MSHRILRQSHATNGRRNLSLPTRRHEGQALAEYVLILALVAIALIAVLTITGPAVGDVFNNAVYNLLGGTVVPRPTLPADDFWEQVAAVASYTPENPLSITNTPGPGPVETEPSDPPGGGEPTEPPPGGGEPTEPPPGGDDPTEEPTEDPETPEPSPEPTELPDIDFPYPFEDTGNHPDWWDTGDDNVLGEWNAEFWNYDRSRSNMNALTPGSGRWRTTYGTLDHYWASGASPGGGVNSDFYARFTTTATLKNEQYVLRLRKDDGLRVWVGGVLVFDEWQWSNYNWKTIPFTPTAGTHEVVVELFDSGGAGGVSLFIMQDGQSVNCTWTLSDEAFYSAPTAWTDSAGGNYAPFSTCVLRLRGTINLAGAVDPKLEFYDRYALASGAVAKVGIAIAGTDVWTEVTAHSAGTNLSWMRQVYDLTNFGGQDFRDQVIELRFVLDNESANTGDGWWIDDIAVEEQPDKIYTVGFSDNMEGASHWFAGGSWARTNEWSHSPGNAWSDSPGANYSRNTDNVLELDGKIVLDNEQLEGNPVAQPELVFWHRYELGSGASAYAEISLDNRQTWTRLTGTHIVSGSTNKAFTQVVIPLDAYIGQTFHFRFRLNVSGSAAVADGWYIDDFALRNRYDGLIHLNWCDDVESGGGSWLPMGSWAVVQGADDNPGQNPPITAHSGSSFFSDSPERNYEHGSNSILQLQPRLNLTTATRPELVFWHKWDIAQTERLNVEVSTNLGQTWTSIWTKTHNSLPPGFHSSIRESNMLYFDSILSWTRESIDLSPYVGTELMLRFRLDATSDSRVDDGWWLDDICVQERVEPIYSLPFVETFESGTTRWHWGGSWARTSGGAHSGSYLAEDSPGGSYQDQTAAVLELNGAIDLRGAVQPTLYIWDRFVIGEKSDNIMVEIRSKNSEFQTWSNWERLDVQNNTQSTVWTRRQLGSRKTLDEFAGKLIQLRFRVYAETGSSVSDGWYIDDITIIDRAGTEDIFPLPFRDDADVINDYWVFDGTWARTPALRPLSSDLELGPGGWKAEYFIAPNPNIDFSTQTPTGTNTVPSVNIDWQDKGPIGVGMDGRVDNFFVRFSRNIIVAEDGTTYQIQTRSDDRIRVFVNGQTVINYWQDRGFPTSPDTGEVTLDAGSHEVVVEFYENGGSARVEVRFAQVSHVYTDSPSGNYLNGSNAAMTLEGMIDLRGADNPLLSFWNLRQRGSSDTFRVEVSTDGGYTWNSVTNWTNSTSGWQREYLSLNSYRDNLINIRFRLDARNNSGVSDGWYIDDIQVYEG